MTDPQLPDHPALQSLRAIALALPGVSEGVACAGTPVEKRTLTVRGKAFLFLGLGKGSANAMVKLGPSLADALELARAQPTRVKVGATGWVTVTIPAGEDPPEALGGWIAESHGLFVGRGRPA